MNRHQTPKEIEAKLKDGLRQKGYKLTTQRLEVIKFLASCRSHPGAMDILSELRKKTPSISMSTVYYTLDLLKKEGLIKELEFYDRENRYDINISDHFNLICRKCGKIEDFMKPLPFSAKAIESKTGFRPLGVRLELYGYCKDCKGREQK
ncbi:MAG TPA: Fur family transcriptional regulator [Dissulfurispiraceae bacterium]|nr:Fur family transcriptional regulator [Dissulfurispiraceae bacterium]